MTLLSSGGGLGTLVEESSGEEGYVVLLLARNLGCDLRVDRTFGAPNILLILRRITSFSLLGASTLSRQPVI